MNSALPTNLSDHLSAAINHLSDHLSYAGCNDYDVADTPENRALWDEYQAWNFGVPLEDIQQHEDYCQPYVRDGVMIIDDHVWIYLLKKALNKLD